MKENQTKTHHIIGCAIAITSAVVLMGCMSATALGYMGTLDAPNYLALIPMILSVPGFYLGAAISAGDNEESTDEKAAREMLRIADEMMETAAKWQQMRKEVSYES